MYQRIKCVFGERNISAGLTPQSVRGDQEGVPSMSGPHGMPATVKDAL